MKKKILGLSLIAMSFVALNVSALDNSSVATAPKQENAKDAIGKCARKQLNPFEGLNLSDAQKAQLKQLETKRKEACKQQKQARKEEKQRNDQAKKNERIAAKKSYLQEVKSILGPEQYVIFLENSYINAGCHKSMKHIGQKGKKEGGKSDKKLFKKGHRPDTKNGSIGKVPETQS